MLCYPPAPARRIEYTYVDSDGERLRVWFSPIPVCHRTVKRNAAETANQLRQSNTGQSIACGKTECLYTLGNTKLYLVCCVLGFMARPPQDVTDAELAVLGVLWDEGTVTVRQITNQLYAGSQGSQHATVQKLLDRLKAKGFVRRDRSVWPHVFAASIVRGELIGRRLRTTAEKLCGGSLSPLLTHLIKDTGLSRDERQSLRNLLDELDS